MFTSCLIDHEKRAWAMIGAKDVASDDVVADLGLENSLRDDKVVEPPSDVLGSRSHHVRPEGVHLFLVRIKVTIGVDKSFFQKFVESLNKTKSQGLDFPKVARFIRIQR